MIDISWSAFLGGISLGEFQFFLESFSPNLSVDFQKRMLIPAFLLCGIGLCFLKIITHWSIVSLGEKVTRYVETTLVSHYLSLSYAQRRWGGKHFLPLSTSEDSLHVKHIITSLYGFMIPDILTTGLFLFWIFSLNAKLFLFFVIIFAPLIIIIPLFQKNLKFLIQKTIDSQEKMVSQALEIMLGWETIQIYQWEKIQLERFEEKNQILYHYWRRAMRARVFQGPFIQWVGILGFCLLLFIAVKPTPSPGETSLKNLQFFLSLTYLIISAQSIANHWINSKKGRAAWNHFKNFIKTKPQILFKQSEKISPIFEHLESFVVEDLKPDDLPLKPLNFSLKNKEILVLEGVSGIGKTSLLHCLIGMRPWKSGKIFLNGQPSYPQDLAPYLFLQTQNPFFLHGSIIDNILYPYEESLLDSHDIPRIEKALNMAGLSKDPYENISGFSQGEKQRLAFARGFYHRKPLWFMDEITSGLDLLKEEEIIDRLITSDHWQMLIFISHRPYIKKYAHHIIKIEEEENL